MTGAESLQFRNWLAKIGYWPVIEAIEQAHRRQAKKPFAYISTICQQASKAKRTLGIHYEEGKSGPVAPSRRTFQTN